LDGGQHVDSERPDLARSEFLEARDYRVFRFWNNDVIANPEAVLQAIHEALGVPSPGFAPESAAAHKVRRVHIKPEVSTASLFSTAGRAGLAFRSTTALVP
jgi:hypothetical protein